MNAGKPATVKVAAGNLGQGTITRLGTCHQREAATKIAVPSGRLQRLVLDPPAIDYVEPATKKVAYPSGRLQLLQRRHGDVVQ